ncbi:Sec-independent protein translocase subunit TatA/TatB [Candidatus Synchoanobacter obligatus]|uniref:Twin-arginine translocase TatA/TatE family subunit n=1 Tax=Candidatus Synchoanobacter obligatus TaxID=2919597 RepID=A0ABT1L4L8_9GAMM|nr:twin-arginine translocase TatA/TatE family subunit [Candidatus Synchoanobacter obligatus]MCP8352107.1 twin-arginine translocase TatA/TatE family subunit [Candidatus Synchoanobacter obligatus]
MFRMGSGELLVVVFVAMLFLGPEQIKSLVKRWAETMKAVKHTMQQITDETSQTNE